MNEKIFKAYDIRGIYPDEINEEAAYKIGRAYVKFLKADSKTDKQFCRVCVGQDIRRSSPALFESLVRGITDEGADVYDLGLTTSPMVYFASGRLDVDGGIVLTASHNPAEYNGLKLCRKNAVPIGENSGILDIKKIVLEDNFSEAGKKGTVTKKDIKKEYLDYFSSFINLGGKKFKIVVDPANAMGVLELDIYKKFPENIELVSIYDEFDNTFPNHEANPIKTETLKDLQKKVLEVEADLGIAYDGDADRIGFIDEKGKIIPMDLVTGMLAKVILEKHPGAKILYDLRSSNAVKEIIEENGGIANECRQVGHSLIKKQMRDEEAIFAGELSGHYYFEENYKAEAGSLPVIYLLNLMAESGKKISELASEIKRYYHSGEINSEVENKDAVIQKLKEIYKDGEIGELDGVKISFWENYEKGKRWWFNVRPSNTEPTLRLNLEADNEKLMKEKRDEILKVIRSAN